MKTWAGREVLHVAGDDGEAVALGGGHEQGIHHLQRRGVQGQETACEALFDLVQPGGEFPAAARVGWGQLEDPFFDLTQADDAEKKAFLLLLVQPGDNPRRRGLPG